MNCIEFYRTKEPYGEFSNFYRIEIFYKGKTWPTSEHAYQAMKFLDESLQEKVRSVKTPKEAAAIGRDKNNPLRVDWDNVKDDIMREIVLCKFKQHLDLGNLLVGTGDAVLAEHSSNDYYWADGGDGTGKNMLGIILMEVREKLHQLVIENEEYNQI